MQNQPYQPLTANREQSQRLKDAGFPQGIGVMQMMWVHYQLEDYDSWRLEPTEYWQGDDTLSAPSDAEMMDWLVDNTEHIMIWRGGRKHVWWIEVNHNKEFHGDGSFTECLVQACVAVARKKRSGV